jgi:predicted nucleic acid-binding protein
MIAVDTNILVYAEGLDDHARRDSARQLLSHIPREQIIVAVQVIGELFNVLTRRGVSLDEAGQRTLRWKESLATQETSPSVIETALEMATTHHIRIWDAVILAAAAEARCDLLLSEDFQDGFAWRGVTVVNPFAAKPHKMLTKLLRVKP